LVEKKCWHDRPDRADGGSLSDVAARTLNVRNGSLAVIHCDITPMAGFGWKADANIGETPEFTAINNPWPSDTMRFNQPEGS